MAIDTAARRASATFYFPHTNLVWPLGEVNRRAAAWIYSDVTEEPVVVAVPEVWFALSEITKTLGWISEIIKTMNRDSRI